MNLKNSITKYSALFLLALTLTWLLSIRPVRLKIGDYYFKQGKSDQSDDYKAKRWIKLTKGTMKAKYALSKNIFQIFNP